MTKLPDNPQLLRHYRDGLSDEEISALYGCTPAAVNKALGLLGISRQPYSTQVRRILDGPWPGRAEFTGLNRARDLYAFMRRRLGDKKLTPKQIAASVRFERSIREGNVVLDFRPDQREEPWVLVPRRPSDGRRVIRWPEECELPKNAEVLDLPDEPWS